MRGYAAIRAGSGHEEGGRGLIEVAGAVGGGAPLVLRCPRSFLGRSGIKPMHVVHAWVVFIPVQPVERMTTTRLREQFGARPFRVAEAIAAGTSRTTLHRLREAGELVPVSRGVLQLPDVGMGMQSPMAAVSARAPDGTICLNSALAFWDLTDEIPAQVHLAVPRGAHRPTIDAPATRVHAFAVETFDVERQQVRTDVGEPFWIYSPERSIVDAIRMARWVGRDVGLHALRRYVARPDAKPAHLTELAREVGGGARLSPALEALLS